VFEQTFVSTRVEARTPASLAASLAAQVSLVAVISIIPLLHVEELPRSVSTPPVLTYLLKPAPPAPPAQPMRAHVRRNGRIFAGPIPQHVKQIVDDPVLIADAPEGPAFSFPEAATGPLIPAATLPTPPQPPAPVPQVPTTVALPQIVHVSQGLQAARLIFGPRPAYPALARAARVQGAVRLAARIGANGLMIDLQVVSGPPLLIQAAVDAVRQWRYQPTLLNGSPVEVATTIDVNFTLSQ